MLAEERQLGLGRGKEEAGRRQGVVLAVSMEGAGGGGRLGRRGGREHRKRREAAAVERGGEREIGEELFISCLRFKGYIAPLLIVLGDLAPLSV